MLGASSEDIARHIGWCSTVMVDHYNRANKVVPVMDTAEKEPPPAPRLSR